MHPKLYEEYGSWTAETDNNHSSEIWTIQTQEKTSAIRRTL